MQYMSEWCNGHSLTMCIEHNGDWCKTNCYDFGNNQVTPCDGTDEFETVMDCILTYDAKHCYKTPSTRGEEGPLCKGILRTYREATTPPTKEDNSDDNEKYLPLFVGICICFIIIAIMFALAT